LERPMSATQTPINFKTEAEVLEYYKKDKDNNQVVIFEGIVYDVKNYMPEHPGGGDLIEKLLGMNIDEDFEEAEHTKTAKKLFKDLTVVGKMSSEKSDEIS
jgi:cytochrome b involved in lipid metabolism